MKNEEILKLLMKQKSWRPDQEAMIAKRLPAIVDQISEDIAVEKLIEGVNQDLELPDTSDFPPTVQAIFSSLFTDQPVAYDHREALSLVFVKQDPFLLGKMRELLQHTLLKIYSQLQQDNFSHQTLIGHILSYLPFFDVQEGEEFAIPVYSDGAWHLIRYTAQKLLLTPPELGSSIVAIGLDAENCHPILLFKGTSYPTDEGFALGVLTDVNPGASVGAYVFYFGKEKIKKWINDRKVNVFGLSLGGALALRTAAEFPNNIHTVFAFNPPALLPWELKRWQNNAPVHVIYHENDIVPAVGFSWGEGWNIYRVFLEKKRHFIPSHFKCFVARKNHIILKANRKQDERKWSRILLSSSHFVLSFFLFPLLLVIYLCLNIRHIFKILFKRS